MVHDSMTDAPRRSAGQEYEIPQPLARLMAALEDFDAYLHQITQQWPKAERHGLSARCREQMTEMHRLVAVAWKRKSRAGALFDLDVELHVLKTMVRKAWRLKYINDHRLEVCARHLAELGRMVGAWIKHESAKAKGGVL